MLLPMVAHPLTPLKLSPSTSMVTRAMGRRESLSLIFTTALTVGGGRAAYGAILEADDDVELLERVKKDRQKRLEKQGVINSSKKEAGYVQEAVYKLLKLGEAIDKNDLPTAISIVGPTDWIQNANAAFNKLSSSPEEKVEVETFNSSIASLLSSVSNKDLESTKLAYVKSATALQNWIASTGLVGQINGLN